jgi:hypothetical protein
MATYLTSHGPNEHRPGRKTAYVIADFIDRGQAEFEKKMIGSVGDDIEDGRPYELEEDDITVEL